MKSQQFKVVDAQGIHARPASQLVSNSTAFASTIALATDNKEANVKSILSVMSLALRQGDDFTLRVEGADEEQAFTAISTILVEMGIAQ